MNRSSTYENPELMLYSFPLCRFRRLFNSASAFALILPPIFLAYSQAESIPAIREAIEYAFRRLFNVHVESMVFQSIVSLPTTHRLLGTRTPIS